MNTEQKLPNDEFTAFAAPYQLTDQPPIPEKVQRDNKERVLSASLDARIVELIQHVILVQADRSANASEFEMFLSFLFEAFNDQ